MDILWIDLYQNKKAAPHTQKGKGKRDKGQGNIFLLSIRNPRHWAAPLTDRSGFAYPHIPGLDSLLNLAVYHFGNIYFGIKSNSIQQPEITDNKRIQNTYWTYNVLKSFIFCSSTLKDLWQVCCHTDYRILWLWQDPSSVPNYVCM